MRSICLWLWRIFEAVEMDSDCQKCKSLQADLGAANRHSNSLAEELVVSDAANKKLSEGLRKANWKVHQLVIAMGEAQAEIAELKRIHSVDTAHLNQM